MSLSEFAATVVVRDYKNPKWKYSVAHEVRDYRAKGRDYKTPRGNALPLTEFATTKS